MDARPPVELKDGFLFRLLVPVWIFNEFKRALLLLRRKFTRPDDFHRVNTAARLLPRRIIDNDLAIDVPVFVSARHFVRDGLNVRRH